MERKEWINWAIENHIKKCFNCKKWTNSRYEDLDNDFRLKICNSCGFQKKLEIAKAFFKTENEITYRLENNKWKIITQF